MLVKLDWLGYRMVKNYDDMLSRFHLIPERNERTDRRIDGRTDWLYQYSASVCWRAIKTIKISPCLSKLQLAKVGAFLRQCRLAQFYKFCTISKPSYHCNHSNHHCNKIFLNNCMQFSSWIFFLQHLSCTSESKQVVSIIRIETICGPPQLLLLP